MTFTQSDATKMRLKLAHLIFIHRNTHEDGPNVGNHNTREMSTSISNTAKDSHMISQDHSSQSSPSQDHTASGDNLTGYCTIMNMSNRIKRKVTPKPSATKKRMRPNPPRIQRDTKVPSGTGTKHQLSIPDLLAKTTVNERKRKRRMDITDEEHPFKQKRYKEDNNK
jgi:hypothetical protein